MRPRSAQRGAALIALVVILSLGGAWFIVSRLNEASADFTVANSKRNAAALAEAKQALIGYVALKAAQTSEQQPGALPCPESAADAGGANEGTQATSLALPTVGRLPWKTLGIDRLVDAAGEPLWYVVASGWGNCAATQTVISSNCTTSTSMACNTGQLTVDGRAKAAVALIIAPGRAMNVQAASGCTARNQLDSTNGRKAPASGIDPANYVECYSGSSFSTSGVSTSFNDQVLTVTAEELLPAIEAAVADRFERQIAPQLRAVYSGGVWSSAPTLPFATQFGDPATSPTNRFEGASGRTTGLLPLSYAFNGPCACASPPCTCTLASCSSGDRCRPGFVAWSNTPTVTRTGGANLHSYSCTTSGTPTTLTCTLNTYFDLGGLLSGTTWMTFNLDAVATNAGMALRTINLPSSGRAPSLGGIDTAYVNSPIGYNVTSATLNATGNATIRINARVPGGGGTVLGALGGVTCSIFGIPLCYRHTVTVPMGLLSDHPLVDPTNTTYSWFLRNKWHEVAYYAVAPGIAPGGGGSCSDSGSVTCLQATHHTNKSHQPDTTKLRGVVVFAGRSLSGAARPNGTLTDWLEGANADGASPFTVRDGSLYVNRPSGFNDRIAVIDSN